MLDNNSWWRVKLVLEAQCTVRWQVHDSAGNRFMPSYQVLHCETLWEQKTVQPHAQTLKLSRQMRPHSFFDVVQSSVFERAADFWLFFVSFASLTGILQPLHVVKFIVFSHKEKHFKFLPPLSGEVELEAPGGMGVGVSRSRSSSVVAAHAIPTRSSAGYNEYRQSPRVRHSAAPSVGFEKAGSVHLYYVQRGKLSLYARSQNLCINTD